jgi:hypothetical protein
MTGPGVDAVDEIEEQDDDEVEVAASGAIGELTVQAPEGAEFELEEVRTQRGTKSLGQVPILTWRDLEKAREHFGDEGILDILDGTSARVSYQSIGRRFAAAGKSMDDIATAQVNFRPGKRAVGVSTPVSRASNAARRAATKLGDKAENITRLLERIAKGEISEADQQKLNELIGE